jgi:tetratricopeptide (TPR) repeat protein
LKSRKDKILESAQKFIAKGQLDKAIKDYQEIVALDRDIRHRQRLAELYVKANMKEEAVSEYAAIAKHYADDTHYVKAIAVYKQIQKLEPNNIKTNLMLGALNAKQGLVGNSLAEYGAAFSYYEKSGDRTEALAVLEKMLEVDPENLNTQLRFAETHFAAGMKDKAYEEFTQLAHLLQKQGDESAFTGICHRIQQLFPDRKEFLLDLLAAQVANGEMAKAIPRLKEILSGDRQNLRAWQLMVEAMRGTGDFQGVIASYRYIISLSPGDPDARLGLIQAVAAAAGPKELLKELKTHSAPLIEQGKAQQLENYYETLLKDSPEDIDLLKVCIEFYSASKNSEKLAPTKEILDRLMEPKAPPPKPEPQKPKPKPTEPEPQKPVKTEPVEPEPLEPELLETLEELPMEEEPETLEMTADLPSQSSEPEWEEEIDLSLDEPEEGEVEIPEETLPPPEEVRIPADFTQTDFQVPEAEPLEDLDEVEVEAEVEAEAEEVLPEEEYVSLEVETGPEIDAMIFGVEDLQQEENIPEPTPPGEDIEIDMGVAETEAEAEDLSSAEPEPEVGGLLFGEDELMEFGEDLFPEEPQTDQQGVEASDKQSLDGLFAKFKIGEEVDKGDTETHFDLGIAYKEMGLFDDAITEFRAATADPQRQADCIILQGICYQEKGDMAQAESILAAGLALEGLPKEAMLSISYEMALLYEASGRNDDAMAMYEKVCKDDPGFRDAVVKLAALGGTVAVDIDDAELLELDAEDS